MSETQNNKKNRLNTENRDLMETIYKDYEKKGGIKELPGFGKPLPDSALTGDIFTNILKKANYLPDWIKLQHQIRDEIKITIEKFQKNVIDKNEYINKIELINQEIRKYNKICPSSLLKGFISEENILIKLQSWE